MKLSDLKQVSSVKLRLLDKTGADSDAPVSFIMLDREGKTLDQIVERDGGEVKLDVDILTKADRVAVLPGDVEVSSEAVRAAEKLSPAQLAGLVQPEGELTLSPELWKPLFPFTTCIDGKVRKCDWWPFFLRLQADRAVFKQPIAELRPSGQLSAEARFKIDPLQLWELPVLSRCRPVCNGSIEIFRRTCCRRIVVLPTDIIDICERLKGIIERIPEIPRIPQIGPVPLPDPIPFEKAGIFDGGSVDEITRNAEQDLRVLQSSDFEVAKAHVLRTPYLARLVYECSEPIRVAEGELGRDGRFSICFKDFPVLLHPGCRLEYAFKVTQRINGIEVVIYNGLAANQWFERDEDICLTTYHPLTRDCEDLPPDHNHGDADVFLSQIGITDAWHLHEHAQDSTAPGVDPVTALDTKTGLVGGSSAAQGQTLPVSDAPWGGTLHLKYFFPDALKATGAEYYRMSVQAISDAGVASGTPVYLSDPITWKYDDGVSQEHAFPLNHPGDATFYKIPYDDHDWVGTQIHGLLDTNRTDGVFHHFGKFLLTLELYDSPNVAGRLVPTGALNNGSGHSQAGFQFAWRRPSGTRPVQPFIGLSHVLWWDNRPAVGDITAINPTDPMSELCQFVEAPGTTQFTANFKAYCEDETALLNWSLWYRRGLEPSTTTLQTGTANHGDASTAPASNPRDFATMLNGHEKCAFALNLRTRVRTWSGYSRISGLDGHDQIAFALINSTHTP